MTGRPSRRAALIGGVAGVTLAATAVRAQDPDVKVLSGRFPTRSTSYPAFVVDPIAPAGAPVTTLLMLHGSGGLRSALPVFLANAERLARRGRRSVIPTYLSEAYDAIDTDDPSWWPQAVRDALAWSMALPQADPARVVGLGYSLGGHLIVQGAVTDMELAAAVGVASAGELAPRGVARRPPILLFHAEGDPVVRAPRVRRWAARLQDDDVPVRIHTLPVSRHAFEDEEWSDVFDRSDAFFRDALAAPRSSS